MQPPLSFYVSEHELDRPSLRTIAKVGFNVVARAFSDRVGGVLGSTLLLLLLWGPHGNFELLKLVWPRWAGPGTAVLGRPRLLASVPWDQEWISFFAGVVLCVAVPCLLIRFVFREPLRAYGLGLPQPGRRRVTAAACAILFLVALPAFLLAAYNPAMQATYPLYRGVFADHREFIVYELGYLAFFVVIEFLFRGFLLFGIYRLHAASQRSRSTFAYYAVLTSTVAYTAWHLGKPLAELWGTIGWGIASGALALISGSIWPLVLVHWLLNACMDYRIWLLFY